MSAARNIILYFPTFLGIFILLHYIALSVVTIAVLNVIPQEWHLSIDLTLPFVKFDDATEVAPFLTKR